jgi:hypothetical protein
MPARRAQDRAREQLRELDERGRSLTGGGVAREGCLPPANRAVHGRVTCCCPVAPPRPPAAELEAAKAAKCELLDRASLLEAGEAAAAVKAAEMDQRESKVPCCRAQRLAGMPEPEERRG